MGGKSTYVWVALWVVLAIAMHVGVSSPAPDNTGTMDTTPAKTKLLYIMMDGFRWDYVDKQSPHVLKGFTRFLNGGVKARWTNPLFPSLSYPTWTSLVTGQYAETHGLVGNYFYDAVDKDVFSLFDPESTGKQKWWTSEPIWTTAEKSGLKTAQYLWARCDVPIDGIATHFCKHFEKIPGKNIFLENIMKAVDNLDRGGYDFVQVYTEHTDHYGHNYGPDSEEVLQAVRDLDDVVNILLNELEDRELTDYVNIVIVSDHGMAYTAPGAIQRHEIDNYLNTSLVENMADKGAIMNIKVPPENIDKVYDQLSRMHGVHVYRKEEIPDYYHYKNSKYVHDIVLVAEEENFVMASKSDKQLPPRNDFVYMGAHGYNPELQSMKGIFFAKGPAFERGKIINPIHVVDVYQVLVNVLELTPNPHNGTWDAVKEAFASKYRTDPSSRSGGAPTSMGAAMLILLFAVFTRFV